MLSSTTDQHEATNQYLKGALVSELKRWGWNRVAGIVWLNDGVLPRKMVLTE